MIKKYSQGNRKTYEICKWICDDIEEISQIPYSAMGSTVFVIHTKDTYMIDGQGVWHSITSDASPIQCDCVEEMTIWNEIPTNEEVI